MKKSISAIVWLSNVFSMGLFLFFYLKRIDVLINNFNRYTFMYIYQNQFIKINITKNLKFLFEFIKLSTKIVPKWANI